MPWQQSIKSLTDEIIAYSPMQRMKKPKPKKDEIKTDSKALTLEQSKRLIECLKAEPLMWRALVMLLLDSGCRRGEAVALRWENVNLKSGYTEDFSSFFQINLCVGFLLVFHLTQKN